jgi:hypothetical protein
VKITVFDHFEGNFTYATVVFALLSLNLSDVVENLNDLTCAGKDA